MPVTRAQALEICTKAEFEVVASSFAPKVAGLAPARLRARIEQARKLQDKYRDLARSQHRRVKGSGSDRTAKTNVRTERKARLFAETRERYERRLARLEEAGG